MEKKKTKDFKKLLQKISLEIPKYQVIDTDGKTINDELPCDLSDKDLVTLMSRMVWTRVLDKRSSILTRQGRLGFFAPTAGQEASQLASQFAFENSDVLFPSYRDIPQLIYHGLPLFKAFLWSRGHIMGNEYPKSLRALPPQIIIGAQYVQAVGVGLALKMRNKKNVAFTYIGDGGSSEGDFYEAINFGGVYKANVVFYIQNNGFAISTPRKKQSSAITLAQKGIAAGIPSVQVDGMDPLAVYSISKLARDWVISGNGPFLIETLTYRYGAHTLSGDDPGRYRKDELTKEWLSQDPLNRFRKYLNRRNLWTIQMEKNIEEKAEEEIKLAIDKAERVPKQKVSYFLKNMFEVPTPAIKEQIKYYEAKASK